MRVAILDDYFNAALEVGDWSLIEGKAEITVFNEPFADENAAASALRDFEAIVGMRERTPFPASLIERLANLKLLITTGMRNFSFDMEAAKAEGVVVAGTESMGHAAAELAWALILGLYRNIPAQNQAMHGGQWQVKLDNDLFGKTLGVVGLGKLGRQVAKVGLAFGMEVIAWSQNLTQESAAECGVERVEKDELMARADVISIHMILGDRSRGLIGAEDIGRMKPTAYLVNTSRGPIVDTAALVDALRENRIAGAAIDVYDAEPAPADHPLRGLDNALLTPHMGYVTAENLGQMYSQAAEDIAAFIAGDPIRVLNE